MTSWFTLNFARCVRAALVCAVGLAAVSQASAAIIVNDTWRDGERYGPAGPLFVPAPPPYAENNGLVGNDADADGDLESAWFRGGAGTWDPVGAGGPLRGTTSGTSSSSWTTYFTGTEGNEVELANVGDKLCITWVFELDGVNASNTSQAFRIAVVDTPGGRMTANGSPGSAAYAGYGMFGNMGQTLDHSRPFDLMLRTAPNVSSALLSAGASWVSSGQFDGTDGNAGYANGVEYTYTFMAERLVNDELLVSMEILGAGLDGASNGMSASYVDTNPASFSFDTFSLRPSQEVQTATTWDTSLFRVEFKPIPEPATVSLLGLAGLAVVGMARRRR
jgi:hypothetical protein